MYIYNVYTLYIIYIVFICIYIYIFTFHQLSIVKRLVKRKGEKWKPKQWQWQIWNSVCKPRNFAVHCSMSLLSFRSKKWNYVASSVYSHGCVHFSPNYLSWAQGRILAMPSRKEIENSIRGWVNNLDVTGLQMLVIVCLIASPNSIP